MPRALAILILAVSTAAAKSRIPKVISLPGDGPVIPLSAENGPSVPKPVEIRAPENLKDSLKALTEGEAAAFAIDPDRQWRCAARYTDEGGVLHFVKGARHAELDHAVRSAIVDCRTAAGKALSGRCGIPALGCRFGTPPKRVRKD